MTADAVEGKGGTLSNYTIRLKPETIEAVREHNLAPEIRAMIENLIQWRKIEMEAENEAMTISEMVGHLESRGGEEMDEGIAESVAALDEVDKKRTYEHLDLQFSLVTPAEKWNRFHEQPKEAVFIVITHGTQTEFTVTNSAVRFESYSIAESAFESEAWIGA